MVRSSQRPKSEQKVERIFGAMDNPSPTYQIKPHVNYPLLLPLKFTDVICDFRTMSKIKEKEKKIDASLSSLPPHSSFFLYP